MNIRIGVEGRVLNSDKPDHYIRVEDDSSNSGGFLIYERWAGAIGPNANGAFDSWVEKRSDLERFFAAAKWKVAWEN